MPVKANLPESVNFTHLRVSARCSEAIAGRKAAWAAAWRSSAAVQLRHMPHFNDCFDDMFGGCDAWSRHTYILAASKRVTVFGERVSGHSCVSPVGEKHPRFSELCLLALC